MSCVIGLEHKGRVWIGGDSASVTHTTLQRPKQKKVFRVGAFLVGSVHSHRGHDIIEHADSMKKLKPPARQLDSFMRTKFVDELRGCLTEKGHATKKDNEEETGTNLLVGIAARLYWIASDYSVVDFADGFTSIGSGSDVALGALAMTKHWKSPRKRIIRALETVARYNVYVCEPFTVMST